MDAKQMANMVKKGIQNPNTAGRYMRMKADPYLTGLETSLFSRFPIGDNVLDEDWDLLVILDTCRYDALVEAKESEMHDWLSDCDIDSRYSVGGSTLEWTAQTFQESHQDAASKIDFVAGNVLVEEVLEGKKTPEEVAGAPWSPTAWNTLSKHHLNHFISVAGLRSVRSPGAGHYDRPHPSADLVTDLAIQHGREKNPDRLIVHYIQPHYPYYTAVTADGQESLEGWQNGSVTFEEVWERYMAELNDGLEAVGRLIQNYDAQKVAISADHGDAFGERWMGIKGYGHKAGRLHPKIRRVPWFTTTATDTGDDIMSEVEQVERSRDEMLEALGYI